MAGCMKENWSMSGINVYNGLGWVVRFHGWKCIFSVLFFNGDVAEFVIRVVQLLQD